MVTPPQIPGWLAELYPFQPQNFTTPGGARMSYVDEGPRHDEAVLMLHGNPTWSFYYRNLIQELSPTMRCVAPDHIGMGLSEKPANYDYSLATRIADIEALVARLGLRKVHLVVHDWGGAIGFGWAGRHPEQVGRIVITNTAAFLAPKIPLRIAICRFPGVGPWAVRALNAFAGPATWMAMSRRKLTDTERAGYLYPYGSAANRVAVAAFVLDIPMEQAHRTWQTLQEVEQKLQLFRHHQVQIIWGGRDFCFNDYFLTRWRQIFPQATADRIPDAGHYVLEDAGDDALGLAEGFLQGK
jgi:pimeloyl-ACP methyl ester carboxylesterase